MRNDLTVSLRKFSGLINRKDEIRGSEGVYLDCKASLLHLPGYAGQAGFSDPYSVIGDQ